MSQTERLHQTSPLTAILEAMVDESTGMSFIKKDKSLPGAVSSVLPNMFLVTSGKIDFFVKLLKGLL